MEEADAERPSTTPSVSQEARSEAAGKGHSEGREDTGDTGQCWHSCVLSGRTTHTCSDPGKFFISPCPCSIASSPFASSAGLLACQVEDVVVSAGAECSTDDTTTVSCVCCLSGKKRGSCNASLSLHRRASVASIRTPTSSTVQRRSSIGSAASGPSRYVARAFVCELEAPFSR
eukprot:scaffold2191_cov254-Pinguiococcus_pyrenoidosus.AAC.12